MADVPADLPPGLEYGIARETQLSFGLSNHLRHRTPYARRQGRVSYWLKGRVAIDAYFRTYPVAVAARIRTAKSSRFAWASTWLYTVRSVYSY